MYDPNESDDDFSARMLEREAAMFEAQAADRYDRSARWYGGGGPNYVRSISTAETYEKKAKALRAKAAPLRARAAAAREQDRVASNPLAAGMIAEVNPWTR